MRQYLISVLLNVINSVGYDQNTKEIARKMLMNLSFVQNSTLEECAAAYYVSVSTLNRFCRKIGMYNYSSLRDYLKQYDAKDEEASFYTLDNPYENIEEQIAYINALDTQVDYASILRYLKNAKTIYYRGFDYTFTYLRFQQGMMMQDKYVELWNADSDFHPKEIGKDDLIFVFSLTGRNFLQIIQKLEHYHCKKICVTQIDNEALHHYFDLVIQLPDAPNSNYRKITKERVIDQILYLYRNKYGQNMNNF
ncbi:MAG: hypothetical protein Q4C49_13800 [Bacillota bacterium]|nr:hypothetical protein [Bacillota bacterium]